ncbi:hypothetical protein [Serinibacter arcticus]|uniref:hypothetical protein n=1 Tax=Serinibacter arcticus TaxID=1655435 RepID=UPI0011B24A13|nr:hypothetical protein [Serinibacter arcticus]
MTRIENAYREGLAAAGGVVLEDRTLRNLRVLSWLDLARWAVDRAPERLEVQVRLAREAVAAIRPA